MNGNLINNYIGQNRIQGPDSSRAKIKARDDANFNRLSNKSFIKPLPGQGRLVKDSIIDYPATLIHDIRYDLKSIKGGFSGDSNDISAYVMKGLENGTIDRLYQDTCGADYEGNYHLSLRRLAEMVEPGLRHKVYCMHTDKYFSTKDAAGMGFNIVEITK
jgi:hypothetical protein